MATNDVGSDRPLFRVLSDGQCAELYSAAEQCLEQVGVRVHNEEARALLGAAGATVRGNIVHMPPRVVREALAVTPRSFALWTRDQQRALQVAIDTVSFGPGLTNTYFVDPQTGLRRRTRRGDPALTARVCDALEHIDYVMGLGLIDDVDPLQAPVVEFAELIANTIKPILAWAYNTENLSAIYRMAVAVVGSEEALRARPVFGFFATYQSPWCTPGEDLGNILWAAERGIPVAYMGGPLVGIASPMTGASTLVITLANALSGLAIVQLKRPGAPMLMGGVPCPADLRTSRIAYGAPETSLYAAAFADLCRYQGLPCIGTAGVPESKVLDSQAAIESAVQLLLSAASGASLVHDLGFLDGAELGSLALLVVTDEIVGMVRRIMRGVPVNAETIMLDLIQQVGPGGHFMGEPRSAKLCRREVWVPKLMDRQHYSLWEQGGAVGLEERAARRVRHILSTHQPAPLSEMTASAIAAILAEAGPGSDQP